MMNKQYQMSFLSLAVTQRKLKSEFFEQVNRALNWEALEKKIIQFYNKGISVDGRPSYSGLVLFKMCLLQNWYGLSDYEVEAQCNDSISFSNFIGIALEDRVPDHSVVSRFRTELTVKGGWELIFQEVNDQLLAHQIIIKTGIIVDASITDTPLRPKGKKVHPIAEDRNESEVPATPALQEGKHDQEAEWLKKAGKLHYGYKKHLGVDEEGMVLSVITTAANESDMCHLLDVVEKAKMPKGAAVKTDKGYCSAKNKEGLAAMGLKSHIMYKAVRGKKLTARQIAFNSAVSKLRFKVERTFGSMKRWSGAGIARYKGLAKTHTQHLLEAMAHNLYRMPGLAVIATQRKNSIG